MTTRRRSYTRSAARPILAPTRTPTGSIRPKIIRPAMLISVGPRPASSMIFTLLIAHSLLVEGIERADYFVDSASSNRRARTPARLPVPPRRTYRGRAPVRRTGRTAAPCGPGQGGSERAHGHRVEGLKEAREFRTPAHRQDLTRLVVQQHERDVVGPRHHRPARAVGTQSARVARGERRADPAEGRRRLDVGASLRQDPADATVLGLAVPPGAGLCRCVAGDFDVGVGVRGLRGGLSSAVRSRSVVPAAGSGADGAGVRGGERRVVDLLPPRRPLERDLVRPQAAL